MKKWPSKVWKVDISICIFFCAIAANIIGKLKKPVSHLLLRSVCPNLNKASWTRKSSFCQEPSSRRSYSIAFVYKTIYLRKRKVVRKHILHGQKSNLGFIAVVHQWKSKCLCLVIDYQDTFYLEFKCVLVGNRRPVQTSLLCQTSGFDHFNDKRAFSLYVGLLTIFLTQIGSC